MQILTSNYTIPISEKYGKMIIQVATIEERINGLMSFGMVDRAREVNDSLVSLLEEIKKEYERDNGSNK